MSTTAILTHGDPDGLVSAILLLKRLDAESSITITNYRCLGRDLMRLVGQPSHVEDVYITDIPLADNCAGEVKAALRELQVRGTRVHLYDHHFGWESKPVSSLQGLFTTYVVDTTKTTAAALVWSRFLKHDGPAGRWLRVLREKDLSNDQNIKDDFLLLLALMQRENYHLTPSTLKSLTRDSLDTDLRKQLIEGYLNAHTRLTRVVIQAVEVIDTKKGSSIGWVDLREIGGHVNVTREVIERYGVNLVASVIPGKVILGGLHIDAGDDLSHLHGVHPVGGIGLVVAGHRNPVSISPAEGCMADDEFVEAVGTFLSDRL